MARTGVDAVLPSSQLAAALGKVKVAFTPFSEVEGAGASRPGANGCAKRRAEEEWDQAEPAHKRFIRLLKERVPGIGVEDAVPLISKQRVIKSPAEIEVLRKAGALSAMAVIEAMKATRPGVSENDLQALAEYIFRIKGRAGTSYHSIVAGGQRTWDGHYHLNSMTLRDGEVVLMDCAPDFRHYTSDIGRVWPVNGTFSPWHRMVCGFIREYHETLLGMVRPGALLPEIYRRADERMRKLCDGPGTPYSGMKALFEQMIAKGIGYFNHAVGMSAHDCSGPWGGKEPLREGMVFVCDPMVWCNEEHQYLRVEDTVVVTSYGCERLTGAAPTDLDEIEALVGSGTATLPFFADGD
jgi:Xaa-Pro aminopeptidase